MTCNSTRGGFSEGHTLSGNSHR